ncbi:MAG: cellulose biosynthesis protein BcsQ [Candidatus Azotimanducaceae bacterium]|jgi:cellulose biosynthesis protein BcsQ
MPATQIAFFNHKGGVSKTTSAFNIGWKLAELGKRVMLVDCDSQCNLTGLVLEYSHEDVYPFEGEKNASPMNIRDGLAPAFEARPVPLKPVILQQVLNQDGLLVLPGHVGLSEYESTLAIAHELSNSLTALQNIPGSLRHLFNITAEENDIEYVIIDMSPSLGALNQNLLCSSDAFIVPMAPDFFSAMALRSLARILPTWKKWSDKAASTDILVEADYPWPNSNPKYLGSIVQNYRQRARGNQEAKPTKAYQKWFEALADAKVGVLLPKLSEIGYLLDKQVYEDADAQLTDFLMEVPDFNSLIALSQTHSKPVFALSDDELQSSGIVLEVHRDNIKKFNEIYLGGAQKIINLL